MLDEKQIKEIIELRGKGLTVKQTAKALEISESTVKKYSSNDYEKNNEIDEKTGKSLSNQMIEEEYDFEDDIKPLVYKLKLQANELNITLHDYLNDISNNMDKFLKITTMPERFYYLFCELCNNLNTITEHIEANDLMNAIDNFYDREIKMENAEAFINEIETKAERIVNELKEEVIDLNSQIKEHRQSLEALTSVRTIMVNKLLERPNEEKLQEALENFKSLQIHAQNLENSNKQIEMGKQLLLKKLELTDKENQEIKQEISAFNLVFEKLNKVFPQQINDIVQEIENNEIQQ